MRLHVCFQHSGLSDPFKAQVRSLTLLHRSPFNGSLLSWSKNHSPANEWPPSPPDICCSAIISLTSSPPHLVSLWFFKHIMHVPASGFSHWLFTHLERVSSAVGMTLYLAHFKSSLKQHPSDTYAEHLFKITPSHPYHHPD